MRRMTSSPMTMMVLPSDVTQLTAMSGESVQVYRGGGMRVQRHCNVCRPPYRPQDGPVEFAINQVCCGPTRCWSEVSDLLMLKTLVEDLIDTGISGMDATFNKCGYIWS